MEREMRQAHLNDTLAALREVIGTRNAVLATVVRATGSESGETRAWAEVREYTKKRDLLVRVYHTSRKALKKLGVQSDILKRFYRPIRDQDLQVNKDLTEANRYYQKNDTLPWFWLLENVDVHAGSQAMKECMSQTS